jgi:hypothetical protein
MFTAQQRANLCSGCEAETTPAALVGGAGRVAWVCLACYVRATESTVFRGMVERAVAIGVTLPRMRMVFAAAGFDDLPTTPEQVDRAWGLPLGSTRAAVSSGGEAP